MVKARDVEGLHPDLPFAEAAARTVALRAQELQDAADGVLDVEDPERVHRMRVASRRLRAVLEIYAPCFPKERYKPVLADVKLLADALGARRDPDVQLISLDALAAALPEADRAGVALLADEVRSEQATGNRTLAAALEQAAADDLYGALQRLADAARPEDAPPPAEEAVA